MSKSVWFIDDEPDILDLMEYSLSKALPDVEMHFALNWEACKGKIKAHDLCIHDLIGVGEMEEIEGVTYKTCSGSVERPSDFEKPFEMQMLIDFIQKWSSE